ncbi:kelch motif domain-containing protein, putative [Eimeria necatrix]|uniref:Kelch motif domain-containing protein, putative n=1 Tax=Eimeria necatrix TaxID=51315 RepID=U6MG03_9EIME|nr:kelch motif domain-containing protein, putative [Eimeria necatrix]CDJ61988.1 kelch motif domain-containing protein, putative [Eimeria necatrix]
MSDISDFSESDFDKPPPPPPPKGGLARGKTGKVPFPPTKNAAAAAAAKLGPSSSVEGLGADLKKGDNKDGAKDLRKAGSNVSGDKDKDKGGKTENEGEKKSSKPVGRRAGSGPQSQPSLDKATGVLSPPDFFISKIVHDGQCFTPRVGHCVVEAKGSVYLFGGENEEKTSSDDMIRFDPNTNDFELVDTKGSGPGPRRGASLTLWRQSPTSEPSLLLFGGMDESQVAVSESWMFDLASRQWKEMAFKNKPDARHSHASVYHQQKGTLLVFGGQGAEGNVLQDAHILEGSSWRTLESATDTLAPCGRCGHSASLCELSNKFVVAVFGGDISGTGKGENDLWLYDIAQDSWDIIDEYAGEPPCPRWKHAAAFFDNRLWIIGGTYAGWFRNYIMSDFFVFDFLAKCWFKCDVDPKDLGSHTDVGSLTVLPSSRAIFIFGGADQRGCPCADVYRLAPVCTTISLSGLRQDMQRTVAEVKQMRLEMDKTLQETGELKETVTQIASQTEAAEAKLQGVADTASSASQQMADLVKAQQQLQASLKRIEESVAQAEASVKSFSNIEKRFGVMEVTVQEVLAKLEQKADISSLRAIAAKVGTASDDEEA